MNLFIPLCVLCVCVAPQGVLLVEGRSPPAAVTPTPLDQPAPTSASDEEEPYMKRHHRDNNIAELLIPLLERSLQEQRAAPTQRRHSGNSKPSKKVIQVLPYRGSGEHKRKGWRKLNSHKKQVVEITPLHGKNRAKPLAYILSAAQPRGERADTRDDSTSVTLERKYSTSEEQQSSEEARHTHDSEDISVNMLRGEGDASYSPSGSFGQSSTNEDGTSKEASMDLTRENLSVTSSDKSAVTDEDYTTKKPVPVKFRAHKVKRVRGRTAAVTAEDTVTAEVRAVTAEESVTAEVTAEDSLTAEGRAVTSEAVTAEEKAVTAEDAVTSEDKADTSEEAVTTEDKSFTSESVTSEDKAVTKENKDVTSEVTAERAITSEDADTGEVTAERDVTADDEVTASAVTSVTAERAVTAEVIGEVTAEETAERAAVTVEHGVTKEVIAEQDVTSEVTAEVTAERAVTSEVTAEDTVTEEDRAATAVATASAAAMTHHNKHTQVPLFHTHSDLSEIKHLLGNLNIEAKATEDSEPSAFIENDIVIHHAHHADAAENYGKLFNARGRDIVELVQSSAEPRECADRANHERSRDHKSYRLSFLFNKK